MTNELFNSLSTMDELLTKIDNGADHFYHNFKGDGIIIEAQREIFNRNISRNEFNCPRCVHKLYKAIAKEYIKEKYDKLISDGITPVRRMGQPEDVARAVLCCASGNLDFCTGSVINADGGFSVRRL